MSKSLSILSSSAIYKLLTDIVGSKVSVCPVVAAEDTASPFIIYQRVASQRSKLLGNARTEIRDVTYIIRIVDLSYERTLNIADSIITAIDGYKGIIDECSITDISIEDDAEEFNSDAFIQIIKIRVQTTKV